MIYRAFGLVWIAFGLSGCVAASIPRVPMPDLKLPRLEGLGTGVRDTSFATTPYRLSLAEVADIKSRMASAYRNERALRYGPISARQKADTSLVICGFVDVPTRAGDSSGMRLFDGVASPGLPGGRLAFQPRRIAGRTAPQLDVYSTCRDAGML